MRGSWKFDGNDWFLVISMAVLFLVIVSLPRRFPAVMSIPMLLYPALLVQTTDLSLGGVYDLYDFLDAPIFEPTYIIAQLVLYPEIAYLFLYFYEKLHLRAGKLVMYIAGWVAFSTAYEWLSVQVDVLRYKGWRLLYSVPVYVLVFISLVVFYHWVQHLYEKKDTPLG